MPARSLRFTVPLISIALLVGNAWAACAQNATVFSCTTAREKRIEICETGDSLVYSFGHPNAKPEMSVRVKTAQAKASSWRGAVKWRFYAIDIPNGNTVYNIYFGTPPDAKNTTQEGGVNVLTADAVTATVTCNPSSIVQIMASAVVVIAGN
jgi:hypothetical protein